MQGCSHETEIVSSLLLDKHVLLKLEEIASEMEDNINYDSAPLWELQDSLVPNHPHNLIKNIMTPLQCARDEIEICNINYSGNYVILYCCKYLEEITRYFLCIMHPVMKLRYKITPLSNVIHKVSNFDFISPKISEGLMAIFKLGGRCKSSDNIIITAKDAISIYICSMIIGTHLLNSSDSHIKQSEEKCLDSLYNIDMRS